MPDAYLLSFTPHIRLARKNYSFLNTPFPPVSPDRVKLMGRSAAWKRLPFPSLSLQESQVAKIFGGTKAWQIVVIAIGSLAAICGVAWTLMQDNTPPLTRVLTLIDVSTGDIYEIDTSKRTPVLPEISPKSGKASLVPMRKSLPLSP